MGGFVNFRCNYCKYEERDIGVGHGKSEFPFLALFRCDHCKSIGSTWVYRDRIPMCSICYHEEVRIVGPQTRTVNCPRCGEPATLTPGEREWE